MTSPYHAVVWIDHQIAKILQFEGSEVRAAEVHSSHPHQHLHHKANSSGSGHASIDEAFLERVAAALSQAETLLITGPASAKLELASYLKRNEPQIAGRIAGIQPLDHPSEGQLLALGRKFFEAADRMRSQFRSGMHQ